MAQDFQLGEVWKGRNAPSYRNYGSSYSYRYVIDYCEDSSTISYLCLDGGRQGQTSTIKLSSFRAWATSEALPGASEWRSEWDTVIANSQGGQAVSKNKVRVTGGVQFPDLLEWNALEAGDVVRGPRGTYLIVESPDGILAVNLETFTAEPEGGTFLRVNATINLK